MSGPPSPLQELEVGGHRPLYLLVSHIKGAHTAQTHAPQLVVRKKGENVHLKIHATARGVSINSLKPGIGQMARWDVGF